MIFGTSKPRICLLNGAGEADIELVLANYPGRLTPSYIPDLIRHRSQDNTLAIFNRAWQVEIDVYLPYISDSDYWDLISIIKAQYDFDPDENYAQNSVSLQPHYTDSDELYYGYITTPIDLLNEFHFLNNGAKFTFKGKTALTLNAFLMSRRPNAVSGLAATEIEDTYITYTWTGPTSGYDGYMVVTKAASAPTSGPVNGTVYTVGGSIGGGAVKKYGSGMSISITGLTAETTYYSHFYAYKGTVYNVVYSGVLEDHQTTIP